PTRPALELSGFQAVERDFAFVTAPEVEALAIVNAAAGADKGLIRQVTVFDQFTGLEDGKKSIGITVRMQSRDKTLTDAEIEAVAEKVVEKVGKATGATLRR
ncbi:MAG: phenylalanine--tRNA ligase subunit beta, partial [Paracoccus sp. (in: a-proteobacteria)]|nr:phenylalanine--tRNA ligase subunit beta [Paracoccus sp. (in: a-proteobacteria)]